MIALRNAQSLRHSMCLEMQTDTYRQLTTLTTTVIDVVHHTTMPHNYYKPKTTKGTAI